MTDCVFLDTNILLDHLLDREPFSQEAMQLWSMAERRRISGWVSAISFNFVYYIVRREVNETVARLAVSSLRDVFDIATVDAQIIHQAADSSFSDFEDAMQHACAVRCSATHLITRDLEGFRHSEVPVMSPRSYLSLRSNDRGRA